VRAKTSTSISDDVTSPPAASDPIGDDSRHRALVSDPPKISPLGLSNNSVLSFIVFQSNRILMKSYISVMLP